MNQRDDTMAGDLSDLSLLYLFHHVFLPPKLPDGDDSSPQHDNDLIDAVEKRLAAFAFTATGSERDVILGACNAIRSLRQLRDHDGHLREDAFCEALHNICSSGTSEVHKSSIIEI